MKAKLKTPTMGRPAGVYEVASQSTGVVILKDDTGEFVAHSIDVELVQEEALTGVGGTAQSDGPPEFVWPNTIVDRVEVDPTDEALARAMYDSYSEATGGVAYNGALLPHSDEFFEDPRAQKQANAWRHVAVNVVELGVKVGLFRADDPEGELLGQQPDGPEAEDLTDAISDAIADAPPLSGSEDGSSEDPASDLPEDEKSEPEPPADEETVSTKEEKSGNTDSDDKDL